MDWNKNKILSYLRQLVSLGDAMDVQAAAASIRENIHFRGPNVFILFFAIIIASVGLNVNSIPVIIGAMLISPLMGPIIGFGMGLTRVLLAMKAVGAPAPASPVPKIYVAALGEAAQVRALGMVERLRREGVYAECDIVGRSLKAQMKYANKIGAKYTMVLGDSEIESGRANLKNMATGEQSEVTIGDDFADIIYDMMANAAYNEL